MYSRIREVNSILTEKYTCLISGYSLILKVIKMIGVLLFLELNFDFPDFILCTYSHNLSHYWLQYITSSFMAPLQDFTVIRLY